MKIFENYLTANGNCELRCVREATGGYNARHKFTTPEEIAFLIDNIFDATILAEEHIWLVCLDTKGHILGLFEIAKGSANESYCSSREIFVRALLCGAVNIILVHNHPSGDVTPSDPDIVVAKKIRQAGQLLNVPLLDFIIVGKDCSMSFYSFAKNPEIFKQ